MNPPIAPSILLALPPDLSAELAGLLLRMGALSSTVVARESLQDRSGSVPKAISASVGILVLGDEADPEALRVWVERHPRIQFVFLSTDPESVSTLAGIAGLDPRTWCVVRPGADPVERLQAIRVAIGAWQARSEASEAGIRASNFSRNRIEELERSNRDLAIARDAAESASRIKSEFLANMSHEIRTPMYGVLGMTDLLLETGLSEVQRDYVGSVRKSGSMLLNILNDILDFSKIEAGKMELDPVPFELREVVGDSLRILGLRADEKEIELLCSIDPGVPDSLVGDSLRLRQVLTNLVTNAIKFTERGEVEVTVRVAQNSPSQENRIHFAVRDTGIGIPEEKKPSIFGAFTQADASTTRRYGGTGLGLTICRRLVEMMGGRIWFESSVGVGSTFHFELPLRLNSAGAPQRADVEDLAGMGVLVIDDNSTNRRILGDMVRQWKMEPTLAENGPDGLAALRLAIEASRRPDLILLDCNMPEMDGFAVAAAIRQYPSMAEATILMLTSSDRAGDARRSRELGLAAYLIKPISQPELLREVRRIAGGGRRPGSVRVTSGEIPASSMSRKLQVLVVDDVAVNRRIAQAKIEKLGHQVTQADGGRRAVEVYSSQGFDLVFMDIQMPEVDGFEATAMIRAVQQKSGIRVPVVAMTAMAMKGDREKCLAAGLDDYISKPIEAGELERILGAAMAAASARLIHETPAPEPVSGSNLSPSPSQSLEIPENRTLNFVNPSSRGTFDPKIALPRCMGEEALLTELLSVYLADSAGYLTQLRETWNAQDQNRFVRAAHKLKGAISYFCSDELAAEARWIEETAARQGMAACAGRLPQFEADVERMNREASDYSLRKAA